MLEPKQGGVAELWGEEASPGLSALSAWSISPGPCPIHLVQELDSSVCCPGLRPEEGLPPHLH